VRRCCTRAGLGDLGRRLLLWRVSWWWYPVVLLGPLVFAMTVAGIAVLIGEPWNAARPPAITLSIPALALTFLILALTDGLGEQLGWRGYLLPRGEDGDSGESGLPGESGESGLPGDSGDSELASDVVEAVSASAPEAASATAGCFGSAPVRDGASAGLARRGCVGPVTAWSAVAVCGEATLAAARTARVAFSGSIACSSSSSGSSRSHTAPSGGIVTEADALYPCDGTG
jgi:hypothetical protein